MPISSTHSHPDDMFPDTAVDTASGFVRANFMQTWLTVRNAEGAAELLDMGRDPDLDLTAWQHQRMGAIDAVLAESLGRASDRWKDALAIHDTLQAWRLEHGRTQEHAAAPRDLAAAWLALPCLAALTRLLRRPGGVEVVAEALCVALAKGDLDSATMSAILGSKSMHQVLCTPVAGRAVWLAVAAACPPEGMWDHTTHASSIQEAARAPFMQARLDRFVDGLPDHGRADVLAFVNQRAQAWRQAVAAQSGTGTEPTHAPATAPSSPPATRVSSALAAMFDLDLLRRSLAARAVYPGDFATRAARLRQDIPATDAGRPRHEMGIARPELEKLLALAPDLTCGLALARAVLSDPEVVSAMPTRLRADSLHVFQDYFATLLAMGAPVERLAMALPPQGFCDAGTGPSPSFIEDRRRILDEMWLEVLRRRDCTPSVLEAAGVDATQAFLPGARTALDALRLAPAATHSRPRLRS